MKNKTPPIEFSPFFEGSFNGQRFSFSTKFFLILLLGIGYLLLLNQFLPKSVFYNERAWLLAAIISSALLALNIAVSTFRHILDKTLEHNFHPSELQILVSRKLHNRNFILSGIFFAFANLGLGYYFGVEQHSLLNQQAIYILYLSFWLAGFVCGMAIAGIYGVIAIFRQITPNLKHKIDFCEPDGCGGTSYLGSGLLIFGAVTLCLGVLISLFLSGFNWSDKQDKWIFLLLHCWALFPYLMTFIVVALPAILINTELLDYKKHTRKTLLQEIHNRQRTLNSTDNETIRKQIELEIKTQREQLAELYKMSSTPFGQKTLFHSVIALLPNLAGTYSAIQTLV